MKRNKDSIHKFCNMYSYRDKRNINIFSFIISELDYATVEIKILNNEQKLT